MAKTERYAEGKVLDFTPGADITAGVPQQIAGSALVGIPLRDLTSGDLESLAINGLYKGAAVQGTALSKGNIVGWDADGTDQGGDSGCYTDVEADWDFPVGVLTEDAASDASECVFLLNRFALNSGELKVAGTGVGGGSTDFQDYIFVAPCRCTVEVVLLTTDTECSSDDGSNNWELQAQNLTDGEALVSSPLNTGDDSILNSADQVYALGVDQNNVLEAGDLLELQATETGTATDLSSAQMHASVRFRSVL